MKTKLKAASQGLGTPAVFFTAISTILGAIMFLRFGYAVGALGLEQSILIIIVGHLITIPTAMAIAEIATNQKVEGGGEYFIISRSFGLNIGGTIGIALFLSQAISVAFYIIAFAQAFIPVYDYLLVEWGLYFPYPTQTITIPTAIILIYLIIKKGSSIGLKMLYFVVAILALSLVLFFLGSGTDGVYTDVMPDLTKSNPITFFTVFAICFPGFTGMTAGVGLSGDLKNPSKSIPLGTMLATVIGMLIYIAIAIKLYYSASPEELKYDQLVMSEIALWGPIIPIGLAAATISSAIGSILVAPRTLQAMGNDNILPGESSNSFVAKSKNNEPINATLVTAAIAFGIILLNDVDLVAEIISNFFMITYGALCLISFFEHFAADPAYRPSFRSKWFLSLLGAIGCFYLMFKMSALYAFVGTGLMVGIYFLIDYTQKDKQGMSAIFQGVISQLSRNLIVFLQKVQKDQSSNWRPSIICITEHSFERFSAFDILRWVSHKYGFGTHIHLINGYLSKETKAESEKDIQRLIGMSESTGSNIYLNTMVSPSLTAAIAQALQLPGVSGKENNMILLETEKGKTHELKTFAEDFALIKSAGFDLCLLTSSIRNFGYKRSIHIWITAKDYSNANLMILMGYIIIGHPQWKKGSIKIFALYPKEKLHEQRKNIIDLIDSGRLPISSNNIEMVAQKDGEEEHGIINNYSKDADLTVIGFRSESVKHLGVGVFENYDNVGDILFINTDKQKEIK